MLIRQQHEFSRRENPDTLNRIERKQIGIAADDRGGSPFNGQSQVHVIARITAKVDFKLNVQQNCPLNQLAEE